MNQQDDRNHSLSLERLPDTCLYMLPVTFGQNQSQYVHWSANPKRLLKMKLPLVLLTFTIELFVFSNLVYADDRNDETSASKFISEVSKLQSRHLMLLVGHDNAVPLGNYKDLLSTNWAKNLEVLNAKLVKILKVGSKVFDYKRLLACGRISMNSRGYRLELYKGIVDGKVDAVLGRYIIYFSHQGKITRIGNSIPLKN